MLRADTEKVLIIIWSFRYGRQGRFPGLLLSHRGYEPAAPRRSPVLLFVAVIEPRSALIAREEAPEAAPVKSRDEEVLLLWGPSPGDLETPRVSCSGHVQFHDRAEEAVCKWH